jgi:hypothetical protein
MTLQMKNRPVSQQPIVIHIHNLPPRWLDVPKAASYLSCSFFMCGELPYLLVGGKRVVEKTDLDAWCDKQEKKTGKLREPKCVALRNSRIHHARTILWSAAW